MPKPITLSAGYSDGVTVIPNTFFDEYLPRANGEFLKIYLYLLRWLSHPDHALSLSGIADIFFMTENDVTRALKYWEAEGLLRLTFDRDGTISGICLNAVTSISSQKDTPAAPPEQAPARTYTICSCCADRYRYHRHSGRHNPGRFNASSFHAGTAPLFGIR